MKNRQELAKHFAELGFKRGAEIGVCKGHYSKTLCESIPGSTIYGVDPWMNFSGNRRETTHRWATKRQAMANLTPFMESGQYILIQKLSMDALNDIPDESLDFVFIDADHTYEAVKLDINGWSKKVRKGGIVSGHDYYRFYSGNVGVIEAVNEYVKDNNIELLLTERDKENPDPDSRRPCWYYIKP